jgi:transcriptional regulator with XRE-family HTH domain
MNKINIASLRKSLKLRQKDFGEKIGIKQAYLSEIESGKNSKRPARNRLSE